MTYYCNVCEKTKLNKSKYNLLKSVNLKILDESNIGRYVNPNTNISEFDEIKTRYDNIYKKNMRDFLLVMY